LDLKRRQLEEVYGRPISETGNAVNTRVIDGNYRFFEPSIREANLKNSLAYLILLAE
jgi:hypothetical protein